MCGRLVNLDTVARVLAEYYHLKTETQLAALDEALSKVPAVSVGGGHGKDHVADPNKMVGDLISRQAAIDALDVLCQEHRYKIPGKAETYSQYNEAWQDALDRAEGAIGDLPSAQPEPIRINLNETIKVKLTDWGKEIYYHQYDKINQIAGKEICKPKFPKEDENGYTEFQLWVFIELYGEHMGMILPNVIEPLEIVYERVNRMSDLISRQDAINVADAVWSVTGDKNVAKVWDQIKDLPSAEPEQLTDKEQRIFLAAMGREEKVCKQVDEECCREPYEDSLVRVCHEIIRKVKATLWET